MAVWKHWHRVKQLDSGEWTYFMGDSHEQGGWVGPGPAFVTEEAAQKHMFEYMVLAYPSKYQEMIERGPNAKMRWTIDDRT